jgi:integrase
MTGLRTALRIGDILRLRWEDVLELDGSDIRSSIFLKERKTDKPKTIALHPELISALREYRSKLNNITEGYIFTSKRSKGKPINRSTAWRIVKSAALNLKIYGVICCHSLRKTFGYHAWQSGFAVVVLMDIYNHSSYEVTKRYLGISQDDRDKVYKNISFN